MPKRILEKVREEISRLYNNGNGISPAEIARRTGVSYASVYGMTKARQRTNPETGEQFKSRAEYEDYNARQRTNPETSELFESLGELQDYNARQRKERKENRELSDLIKRRVKWVGVNQNWLAEKLGLSRQAISLYVVGKSIPKGENLRKLLSALEIRKLPKSLEGLVEE